MKDIRESTCFDFGEQQDGDESAPGVFVTRRKLLGLLPVSVGGLILAMSDIDRAEDRPTTGQAVGWDQFIETCLPPAKKLHEDSSAKGQDAYLYWIASQVARVNLDTMPKAKLGKFKSLDPAVYFGVKNRTPVFFVVEWRMEPGAVLPPHCHPNVSVCTVGLEGEAILKNYEIVGKAPEFKAKDSFSVRETKSERLSAGRINSLSAHRDNIHTFTAGSKGARGIDISTFHGPDIGFSFLEIGKKPAKSDPGIYEATWTVL